MSDFIVTEAIDEDEIQNEREESEGNDFISTKSDDEFIDDESQFEDQNASDYYGLTNIERSYDDAIQDSLSDINFDQEANNYNFDDCDFDEKIDNFKDFNERLSKFKKTLHCPQEIENEDSFFMQFYMQQDIILQKKLIKCQMKKLKKIFRKYLKKCTT